MRGGPGGTGARGGPGGIDYASDAEIDSVSTGLTLSGGVLTSNLSTGVAGGQSAIGGTAAADSLTLKATTHATPTTGAIVAHRESANTNTYPAVLTLRHTTSGTAAASFGATLAYELEAPSGTLTTYAQASAIHSSGSAGAENGAFRLGFLTAGAMPAAGSEQFRMTDASSILGVTFNEPSNGTASQAAFLCSVNNSTFLTLTAFGASFTTSGASKQSGARVNGGGSGGLSLCAGNASGDLRLYSGGTADANQRATLLAAGGMRWATGTALPVATKTGAYTVTVADGTILADATGAAITVTLPDPTTVSGFVFTVKRLNGGGNDVTVGGGGGNIDGAANATLGAQYAAITVQSDGTNWHIIGELD